MNNPYLPKRVRIEKIIDETVGRDIKSFVFSFLDPQDRQSFDYHPGQFAEISIAGAGEIPIGIASSPTEGDTVMFTVKKMGVVTKDLHNSSPGRIVGLRGPYGNGFPMEELKGKHIVIVGGGFAFTTLRALAVYLMGEERRKDYGDITIIYGARTPGDLIYRQELEAWSQRKDLNVHITVDKAEPGWQGKEGFVPAVVKQVAPSAKEAIAIVCGPPIMIKFTIPILFELGFAADKILNSLEMRMKCGLGKCGRCNIGHKYVCKDGPVFTYAELQNMPPEY
ncbi:MAG: FAD/NAD(P)-binding protein [bacterium]|nr:FAD/NAD(P)-binding protein [bacterium]